MKNMKTALLAATALACVAIEPAFAAASTDTTFTSIYDTLKTWAEGSLGKVVAIAMFLVGLAAGVVKQSVMAVVAGVAAALVMAYGPTVIEGMFSALI